MTTLYLRCSASLNATDIIFVYSVLLCNDKIRSMTTQAEKTPLWLDCDPGTDSSDMGNSSYI